jgi:hypothetical protein
MEKSIAERVQEHLGFRPYILDSLEKGYGSLSRISEMIRVEMGLDKGKRGAIKTALRRQSIAIRKERKQMEDKVLQVLEGSKLESKYDVNAVTLKAGVRLVRPGDQDLILSTEFADGNFYVVDKVERDHDDYLIGGQKIPAEKIGSYHSDCTMFIVISAVEAIEFTPGVLTFLNLILSTHNINVIGLISCYTYTILIVQKKDETRAFAALRQIVGKRMGDYDKVLEWCEEVIETDFKSCRLEDEVKKQILELVQEWKRDREAMGPKSIGGLRWLSSCVLAIANSARESSHGNEELRCQELYEKLRRGELAKRFRTKDWESAL